MARNKLGRLERHDLRDVWRSEAADFTPWLAQADNLAILGDALGLAFELEAQERSVGPFRADILCREISEAATDTTDIHWVLIENQLERTNHVHLGQLLTYASGVRAITIVWIASSFTEEHRSALDWLNKIADDSCRFFGVEVELWRIGESLPAPRFNVIARPNNWTRSVKKGIDAVDAAELSDTRILQLKYWEGLNHVLREVDGPVSGHRRSQPAAWMTYGIGSMGCHLTTTILRRENKIRAELHLSGPKAKSLFALLQAEATEIEREMGYRLDWQELPDRKDSRVSVYFDAVAFEDESDWPRQHAWMATRLNDLHRAFAARLKRLDVNEMHYPPGEASAAVS